MSQVDMLDEVMIVISGIAILYKIVLKVLMHRKFRIYLFS